MKKKSILILLVICSIIFITTGTFAYYRYSVNGSIIAKTGNYTFNVTSNSITTKDINLGSNLKPFDKGSFNLTVKLDNTDCDVYYTLKIEKTNLPKGFKFLAQDDNISPFSTYSKYFNASDTKTDTVTIYWYWDGNVDDEDDNSFIGKTISANIVINSKQANPAYMKNGYGEDENANGGTEFWNNNYKPYVRTINFGNDLSNLPSTCNEENLCWDITESGNNKVYGYLIDSGLKDSTDSTKSLYNLYIVSKNKIFAPSNCAYMFAFFTHLISINFNNNFNTIDVTNMYCMFRNCSSLIKLNLSNFNTSEVRYMTGMFTGCSNIEQLKMDNFNTSNVIEMSDMFALLENIKEIDLSNFNTSKLTTMWHMFNGCLSLTNLDLSNFNTTNVTNMEAMFYYCPKLQTTINILNANTTYTDIFTNSLTDTNAKVTIGYTSANKSIVEAMKETAGSNQSKITLKQI